MPLSPNQIIKGALASYRLLHPLKGSTIFKAEILPPPIISLSDVSTYQGRRENRNRPPRTVRPEFVAKSPFIRSLHEGVGDMESLSAAPVVGVTLSRWTLSSASSHRVPLLKVDVNPNNILVSGLDGKRRVWVGDGTGLLEVWMNQGVHHASDIWSLGVTLVHWLMESRSSEREISGLKDGGFVEGYGYAAAGEEFRMADLLRDMDMPLPGRGKVIDVRPLREELERLRAPVVPPALIDFIESLIVVDMEKADRP
ncbi:hypothetical protein VC83_02367 [Pseudogymnoascus destructans]|uniref:Protein kinase domain-containing protein n=1 Tax=Pseudogymnoascus destructans TaxID=655981 RepID=A0A177AGF6_9PEZI|nr:uncharacterized protein VC83_02367 [Pseudogymnoascus destructans]OAF60900.1 hypothetical protein VC83_02367 [Pseudogymnoascus destructans]